MKTVRVICGPRESFPGFGAIGKYFLSNQPQTLEVSDAEYAELTTAPAVSFLHVELVERPAAAKK